MVRATSGKYFYFVVFNVFIGVTLFGTIFSSLDGFKELLNSRKLSVSNVVTLFGNKLPPNATYFITFVALQWVLASHKDPSFYLWCVLLVYIVMTAWEQVKLCWEFDLSEASFFCLEPNFFFSWQVFCWLWFRTVTLGAIDNLPLEAEVPLQNREGGWGGMGSRTPHLWNSSAQRHAHSDHHLMLFSDFANYLDIWTSLFRHRLVGSTQPGLICLPFLCSFGLYLPHHLLRIKPKLY